MSAKRAMDQDFVVDDAVWIDIQTIDSLFEEQLDVGRLQGARRHRRRINGKEPVAIWLAGPAPERDAAEGYKAVRQV